jgi:hypothetical protein
VWSFKLFVQQDLIAAAVIHLQRAAVTACHSKGIWTRRCRRPLGRLRIQLVTVEQSADSQHLAKKSVSNDLRTAVLMFVRP